MVTSKSTTPAEALGIAIKRLRVERELTQEAVAHAAEISVTTLAKIETGWYRSRIDTIIRLANALDISAAELVAECEEVLAKGAKRR
jgi:transcriptional regulator with XRE-family HTH domain